MSVDKEEKFDKMLCKALQGHCEPVPADFAERMLRQIRETENRRILARVVLQGRLALAGCIALGIMAIVAVAVFPSFLPLRDTGASFTEQMVAFIDKISQTIKGHSYDWQFYIVFAGVFGFAACSLVDLLVNDS